MDFRQHGSKATWVTGSQAASSLWSSVLKRCLISYLVGPRFPLVLKEGIEFNILKIFFSIKFYESESEVGILRT